jgi:hypothetical protein
MLNTLPARANFTTPTVPIVGISPSLGIFSISFSSISFSSISFSSISFSSISFSSISFSSISFSIDPAPGPKEQDRPSSDFGRPHAAERQIHLLPFTSLVFV